MVLNVHINLKAYEGREEGGGGIWRWRKREIIYLSLRCHHQNDSCIKIGSNQRNFNVSVGSDGQSHKTVSTNHNLFEEKGEPKRFRTVIHPLTSLTARPNRLTENRVAWKVRLLLTHTLRCPFSPGLGGGGYSTGRLLFPCFPHLIIRFYYRYLEYLFLYRL